MKPKPLEPAVSRHAIQAASWFFIVAQEDLAPRERERHVRRLHRVMNGHGDLASDLGPVGVPIRPNPEIEIELTVARSGSDSLLRNTNRNVYIREQGVTLRPGLCPELVVAPHVR
jgi:hypothetical protein